LPLAYGSLERTAIIKNLGKI